MSSPLHGAGRSKRALPCVISCIWDTFQSSLTGSSVCLALNMTPVIDRLTDRSVHGYDIDGGKFLVKK